jgi:hypothetical protein
MRQKKGQGKEEMMEGVKDEAEEGIRKRDDGGSKDEAGERVRKREDD